jgi:hypothetical protein
MTYHQPCGTFFMESQDTVFEPRVEGRDYAKIIARQRQEIIANELSRQACEDYIEDIMKHMRQMEVNILDLSSFILHMLTI